MTDYQTPTPADIEHLQTEGSDTPLLPQMFTPQQLAEHFGVSQRRIRNDALRCGCFRRAGNVMLLTRGDVDELLEFWRPDPRPRMSAQIQRTYEELVRLRIASKAALSEKLERRTEDSRAIAKAARDAKRADRPRET